MDDVKLKQLVLSSTGPSTDDRVLKSGGSGGGQLRATDDILSQKRKRKPLTEEELEERRKKLRKEKTKRREGEKEAGMVERTQLLIINLKIKEEEEEEEEREETELQYLIGDVTQPQNTSTNDAIIVHCVDDSGRCGRGGLFSAISTRSMQPETYYKKASKMRDLSLSDVHVIPVDDIMSRDQGRDMLALIVAQSRDSSGSLSGIKLPSLSIGLQRISSLALRLNASVHLPRIGHSTPHFNWYGTERLIRKHLSSKGIPTFIYYFPRHGQHKTIPSVSPELQTKVVDPLPDIFTDISVCFNGIDKITKLSLS
uniref:Macro domain-containing protein n=1 Tax=Amphimedon queenslandica TaxID=400682 RepID=A0A1X7TLM6_AMPQE